MPLIRMNDVTKKFKHKKRQVYALNNVNLEVEKGDFIVVLGPSGSGKTTLLNMIAGMDVPTEGTVIFKERNFKDLSEEDKAELRKKHVGFVFQFFNLVDHLTAIENVEIPLLPSDIPSKEIRERASEPLAKVKILDKKGRKPSQLSGGEKQRVAIARALVHDPEIIMADEPVAQLERATANKVLKIFKDLNKEGKTIVIVTTDERIIRETREGLTKEVRIEKGKIQNIRKRGSSSLD